MAWIMKNSGGMQVDRQAEPYLTDAIKAHMSEHILPRYPIKQAATLPVLREVQEHVGWLPYQALEEVADFLELEASQVLDTASFYEEFALRPQGKFVIWVCQSISCELLGHNALLEKCQQKLGIEPGQTTEDGQFTLMTAECLGSCGTAPVALVNERLHENLTADNFDRIIGELQQQ